MTDKPILEAVDLCKVYRMPHGDVQVLDHYSLKITKGESLCIMGASGSGKSTLLHLLAGLDVPDSGEVRVDGEPLHAWRESKRASFRAKRMGVVFQNYHLMPDLDVLQNVLIPTRTFAQSCSMAEREALARNRLKAVGLEDRLHHRPVELSGGEQQRLAVVRALMNDPDILLADEPTGNLDVTTGDRVLDDLFRLSQERERTLVLVTHDPRLAERCDRVVQL
jgi:predicted ABC-type transport system involved in lysophospholipase L1 biosynthesis ATPase subunit